MMFFTFKLRKNNILFIIYQTKLQLLLTALAKKYYKSLLYYWIFHLYNPDIVKADSLFVLKLKTLYIPKRLSEVL